MRDNLQAVYPSYDEAMKEAERIKRDGSGDATGSMVTKVQKSPYGSGFIVRTFPASFLVRSRLRRMTQPVEYDSL